MPESADAKSILVPILDNAVEEQKGEQNGQSLLNCSQLHDDERKKMRDIIIAINPNLKEFELNLNPIPCPMTIDTDVWNYMALGNEAPFPTKSHSCIYRFCKMRHVFYGMDPTTDFLVCTGCGG